MASRKVAVRKHPLWIRWTHWVNFPLLALMIWSGTLIYWANDIYWGFYPRWFYDLFNINGHLAHGMAVHFFIMWFFTLNGLCYGGYLLVSGEWRELFPRKESFREAFAVFLHDLGLRKELPPQGKFNAAQRFAYSSIFFMGMGSIITGLAIYKPIQLGWLVALCGGYEVARGLHFLLTLGYVGFFFIHIAQVIRAGWNNFRAMVTGFEVVDREH
jgi:thiosulfate reductase cytochrome b subunit